MIQLIVGQQAPAPFGLRRGRGRQVRTVGIPESGSSSSTWRGRPNREERSYGGKILTRYLIDESKTMVMPLITVRSSPIIYELVFDPTRYKASSAKDRVDWWTNPTPFPSC